MFVTRRLMLLLLLSPLLPTSIPTNQPTAIPKTEYPKTKTTPGPSSRPRRRPLQQTLSTRPVLDAVPPEHPMVLNRYGRPLNGTILGPMEEGDDIMLTCRVIGGKHLVCVWVCVCVLLYNTCV